MKVRLVVCTVLLLSGCAIERIDSPGVALTRPVRVKADQVAVFRTASEIKGRFDVVDTVFVRDDGSTLPRVLERQLRDMAGARGANAIITDPLNRKLNGTRLDLGPTFDEPFEYFSATAVWIGDGEPPRKYLGTLRGRR